MFFDFFKTKKSRNNNNKTRKKESGLLAKGKHGAAYDLGRKNGVLLFDILDKEIANVASINLYGLDKKTTKSINTHEEIKQFNDFLNNTKNKIVKVMKNDSKFNKEKMIEKDFNEEIVLNRKVIDIYGKKSKTFLTVQPIGTFKHVDLIAALVTLNNGEKMHLIFGHKCDNNFKLNMRKMVVDILESFVVLQKKGYQHDDVKIDNIVLCEDRYKLIDWGKMRSNERVTIRTIFGLNHSPILLYLYSGNKYGSKDSFISKLPENFTFGLEKFLIKHFDKNLKWVKEMIDFPLFKETIERVGLELQLIVKMYPNSDKLNAKYKNTYDIYMFGIAIIYAIFKYKLNPDKYKPLVEKFTSLLNPVKDAEDAIKWVKNNNF